MPPREKQNHFDCIVVGGGPAGVCAAVAAARLGAKTLIIEQQGCLGGALTSMGVAPMMSFHAGARQVIQGLPQEIVERLIAVNGSPGHVLDDTGYTGSVTPFDPEALKVVLDALCLEAGVQVLFHATLSGVNKTENQITSISVTHKAGPSAYPARCFIDATGDGDLSAMAGAPFSVGRESDGKCQPLTKNLLVSNVDIEAVKTAMRNNPGNFRLSGSGLKGATAKSRLSVCGFYAELEKAKAAGEFSIPRETVLFFEMNTPGQVNVNVSRLLGIDVLNPVDLSKAEMEGRKQAMELLTFLRKYIPGFAKAQMMPSADWVGIRESRHIHGRVIVTEHDLLAEKFFEDAIAVAGYPIDIHSADGKSNTDIHLRKGAVYSVPYRALLPLNIDNLLVCGRCLSATHLAAGALRVTPTAMATGQAAGTAIALAINQKVFPGEIGYKDLAKQLLTDKACLR